LGDLEADRAIAAATDLDREWKTHVAETDHARDCLARFDGRENVRKYGRFVSRGGAGLRHSFPVQNHVAAPDCTLPPLPLTPASTSSSFTPTMLLMPGSSMVTPYSQSAASMVRGWCVMTTNCVRSLKRWSMPMKRPMFASSSGASTSSSTQNGLGFTR